MTRWPPEARDAAAVFLPPGSMTEIVMSVKMSLPV